MTLKSVEVQFKEAWKQFQQAGIDSARIDARILLGFVLGGGAERVLAESHRNLTKAESKTFETLVRRRLTHEPISHITGQREFWSLPFKVSAATLIPRPDSETIIETALESVKTPPKKILDLGTGSGCLLLALLNEWETSKGIGLDACPEALAIAQENAQTLGLDRRAKFVHGNWQRDQWFINLGGPFDMVISNPPYILDQDIEGLDVGVRDFEPRSALAGGADGLNAYRIIIQSLSSVLNTKGLVVFEVGQGQDHQVMHMLKSQEFINIESRQDLSGIARVVMAQSL